MIKRYKHAPRCEKHDAYYHRWNGDWLEGCCKDEDCSFCENRPNRHSDTCSCLDKEGDNDTNNTD